ncbi:MAG: DNA gyrase subunit A [Cyanophyceae cyanobacterium]
MPQQLNLMGSGQTIPTSLHQEMQRSYLEYAMSTIVGRALPDARDGLKPVHRRILYAMHELGLLPDRPFRKCARVVGDVLGKYHPHGDKAVYDALVRLAQDFSTRYPLLQGHGNFGSIDNDPPAAMRYTETRLAAIAASAMLGDIGEATVDFADNFDSSQQEPTVLPAKLPNLLLNGCSGIAVGMATNVPPHNLRELVDGAIALIDRPDLSDEELWKRVPGPDFPTGGEILGTSGIHDAYRTGRGSVPLRGVAHFEEIPGGRGRQRRRAIVVTEMPYQTNKAAWLEKVANLVNLGRLGGISDLRDESDREGIRVVVELKREADPAQVLRQLYRQTELQTTFGVILLALVEGQPRQLSLRQLLEEFLRFREVTLTRQFRHELGETEERLELVAGLLRALEQLDDLIDILRHAPDGGSAQAQLVERLLLSERQAREVLAMPLRRLTGMEQTKLREEQTALAQRCDQLRTLLGDRGELLKALKQELRSLKRQFGDDRRTRILTGADLTATATEAGEASSGGGATPATATPIPTAPAASESLVLELSDRGYVRTYGSARSYRRRQNADPDLPQELDSREEVPVRAIATTRDRELLVLTRSGKAYTVPLSAVPPVSRKDARGVPLVTLLPDSVREAAVQGLAGSDAAIAQLSRQIVETLLLDPPPDEHHSLVLLTREGRVKRLPLADFAHLTGRGLTALKLKDDDELLSVTLAQPGDRLVVVTQDGRLVQFPINDDNLPLMNRNTQGLQALKLEPPNALVGCIAASGADDILLVTAKGYGKRLPLGLMRLGRRGNLGEFALPFSPKADRLVAAVRVQSGDSAILTTDAGRTAILPLHTIPIGGKDDRGQRLVDLDASERVTGAIARSPLTD